MRKLTTGALCLLALNAQANVIQFFAAGISYNNASELFKTKKGQFIFGGTGAYADLEFTGSVLNLNTPPVYGSGRSNSSRFTVLPYGRLAKRLNEKVVVAVDVTEPFNSNLNWGTDTFTRYANTENYLTDVDVSPKFSFDVNQKLHVGGGLNFNFVTNNEVNFALPTGPNPTDYANLKNKSTGNALGFNLGATYMINEMNFLGALYYSGMRQNTNGTSQLASNFKNNFAVSIPLPSLASINYLHIFNQDWLMNLKVYQIGWRTMQTVTLYNTASLLPTPSDLTFDMHYKNTYAFQAAVRHQCNKKLGLALVGMIDNAPAQEDLRSLPFPADTQYLLGIAGDYHFTEQTSVELFYGHVMSYPTIQNKFMGMPFTTGNMNIGANVLDVRLKVEV